MSVIRENGVLKQTSIPRVFHWIWIGPKPLPVKDKKLMDSWKKFHPKWKFKLWTNDNLPKLRYLRHCFKKSDSWPSKANLLRYEILFRCGGVYLDTDMECFKPIDGLLLDCQAFVIADYAYINNAMFGTIANHPFLKDIIDTVANNFNPEISLSDGPGTFSRSRNRNDIRIFEHQVFYPFTKKEEKTAYAKHHFNMAWKNRISGKPYKVPDWDVDN